MSTLNAMQNDIGLGVAVNADQYLTFMLAGEEYGVDILRVQEIKGWGKVTPIPGTPEYVRGVMNLRGTIVPILDLRKRFSMDQIDYGPTTVVIVLRVECEGRDRIMGIVVDAVSDVYAVPAEELRPSPDFGGNVHVEFVRGLATVDEKMVIILNIDKLLNADDLEAVSDAE
jgi:purine-binding chemotaxis protein CheW